MDSNIVFSVYDILKMIILFVVYASVFHFVFDYLFHALNGF